MMLTVITEMFGIKGECGAMVLEPKLQKEQFIENRAGIYLNFGRQRWHIVYVNEQKKECGEYQIASLYMDGSRREINSEKAVISLEEIKMLDEDMLHEIIGELQ